VTACVFKGCKGGLFMLFVLLWGLTACQTVEPSTEQSPVLMSATITGTSTQAPKQKSHGKTLPAGQFRQKQQTGPETPAQRTQRVLEEINRFRATHNLQPLSLNPVLGKAAQLYADDLRKRGTLDHNSEDGSSPGQRAERLGYKWTKIAENLALGPRTAHQVVALWTKSPGHRSNLLLPDVTEVGVGFASHSREGQRRLGGQHYWALSMAKPQQNRL